MDSIFDGKKNLNFIKENRREIVVGLAITIFVVLGTLLYTRYINQNFISGEPVNLERALDLYADGDLETSTRILERIYENDNSNSEVAQKLAKQYFELKEYDNFVKIYSENNFSGAMLTNMYANLLSQRGEDEAAVNSYREAIAANPENTNSYINLATFYITKGDLESARLVMDQALKLKPDYTKLLIFGSSLYKRSGDIAKAKELINHALEIDADNVQAQAIAESL